MGKQVQEMFDAVKAKIEDVLSNDSFVPMDEGKKTFHHRQTWRCVKIFETVFLWHGLLSDELLDHLGVKSVLNRYIRSGLMASDDHMFKQQILRKIHEIVKQHGQWLD